MLECNPPNVCGCARASPVWCGVRVGGGWGRGYCAGVRVRVCVCASLERERNVAQESGCGFVLGWCIVVVFYVNLPCF